ncbi:pyrophosphatase [Mycobacterium phage Fowlmouth]|uniref:Nucleotide pyrophosphohydrolase n=1 Tax=Mycobacterium phage Fowlmouth TaxID=2419978 RepID=A0A3G2KGB9_9CAUD|nr:pyrophosphatase [Mycobacterium phage Fowlmouth]AYN58032.1 nucleotide pyrophosphohydrolase [Mycobacterium phage Fowlmouth]
MTENRYVDNKGTLTSEGEVSVMQGLAILKNAVALNNFEKGWRTIDAPQRPVAELAALLHSEVTEAFESYRDREPILAYEYDFGDEKEIRSEPTYLVPGHSTPMIGKPIGEASELADVIIRVLDWADEREIPLIKAIIEKHKFNQTRAYRHGNKAC